MAALKITFHGGPELARRLNAMPAKVSRKIQLDALREAAGPMRDDMQAHAPVDLASRHDVQLHEGIEISAVRARGDDSASVAVGPSKRTFWGLFQEYGYGQGPAQPFARPAFDGNRNTAINLIGQRLWDAVRKGLPSSQGSVGGRFA